VAVVPLVFCALRFSSYFFALIRCFRHATLFVLFILFSFSAQTNIRCNYSVTYYLSPPLATGERSDRGHPAPRQGANKAPWNPLLNSYYTFYSSDSMPPSNSISVISSGSSPPS
jgi:hypothetical protein